MRPDYTGGAVKSGSDSGRQAIASQCDQVDFSAIGADAHWLLVRGSDLAS